MTKVLVIEDEAFLIEEILTTLNFEGFEASGPTMAARAWRWRNPIFRTLLSATSRPPEMDGYAVLDALRADTETASIPLHLPHGADH